MRVLLVEDEPSAAHVLAKGLREQTYAVDVAGDGETALFLVRRHPNVNVDLSGIPPKALPRYFPRLADVADKVVWGTDWPSPGITSPKKNVEEFRALGLPEDVQRKILYENAMRIFA